MACSMATLEVCPNEDQLPEIDKSAPIDTFFFSGVVCFSQEMKNKQEKRMSVCANDFRCIVNLMEGLKM